VPDADLDPGGKVVVGGDVVGADAQPPGHLPALHHRDGGRGRGDQLVRLLGVDVDEHPSLPTGADRHVPADEEGEAAEHLLFRQLWVGPDQVPDATSEDFVIGHGPNRTQQRIVDESSRRDLIREPPQGRMRVAARAAAARRIRSSPRVPVPSGLSRRHRGPAHDHRGPAHNHGILAAY
jgi:hypothetical protein